jgi:hypothetical protein
MKQNWEEKKIAELFQEARREDERLTPSFADLLEADPAQIKKAGRFRLMPRPAFAAILLILSFGAAVLFFVWPKNRQMTAEKRQTVAQEVQPATPSLVEPQVVEIKPVKLKKVRRRAPSRIRQPDSLISQWKPPTDFLLRFPGEKFLKTTPDLVKPLEDIGPFLEEIQN